MATEDGWTWSRVSLEMRGIAVFPLPIFIFDLAVLPGFQALKGNVPCPSCFTKLKTQSLQNRLLKSRLLPQSLRNKGLKYQSLQNKRVMVRKNGANEKSGSWPDDLFAEFIIQVVSRDLWF